MARAALVCSAFVEAAALSAALRDQRPALRRALALGRLAPALARAAAARLGGGAAVSLAPRDVAVFGIDEGAEGALLRECARAGFSARGFSSAGDPAPLAGFAAGVALGADLVAAAAPAVAGVAAPDVIVALAGGPAYMAPLVRAAQRGPRVVLVTRFSAGFERAWLARPDEFRGPRGVEAAPLEDVVRDLGAGTEAEDGAAKEGDEQKQ